MSSGDASSESENLPGPSKKRRIHHCVKKFRHCSKCVEKAREMRINAPISNVVHFDDMSTPPGPSIEIRAPSVKKRHICVETDSSDSATVTGVSGCNIPYPSFFVPESTSSDSDTLVISSEESRTPSVRKPHNLFGPNFLSKRTAAKAKRIPRLNPYSSLIQIKQVEADGQYTDDDDGHLNLSIGDSIDRYTMLGIIGKGTFGRVIKARSLDTRETVALKIVRSSLECVQNAKNEVAILRTLNHLDPEGKNLWVQMLDYFEFQGHVCIAYEKLGDSLYNFMRTNKLRPYQLPQIRHIIYQICYSVKALHDNMIMHTDLKPENICFVSSDFTYGVRSTRHQTYRKPLSTNIRLIDFGSAIEFIDSRDMMIQTRYYRAPEVVFGFPWNEAVDIWSIGCIFFELYTGECLFSVHDNVTHFIMMNDVLGPLPESYLSTDFARRHDFLLTLERKQKGRKPLKRYMHISTREHHELFDLMGKFLKLNPEERIRLSDALRHPFFDVLPDELKLE